MPNWRITALKSNYHIYVQIEKGTGFLTDTLGNNAHTFKDVRNFSALCFLAFNWALFKEKITVYKIYKIQRKIF